MFTRKLALTVATAALLSAGALPAMAANPPLLFDFTTTYAAGTALNPGAAVTLTGQWTTNDAGQLLSLNNFRINGTPAAAQFISSGGSYTSSPVTTGYSPGTTYGVNSYIINWSGSSYGLPTTVSTKIVSDPAAAVPPLGPAGPNSIWVVTQKVISGSFPSATISQPYYQTATFTAFPEIDGGVLPKALFVVAGAFLMFFGRNKNAEV